MKPIIEILKNPSKCANYPAFNKMEKILPFINILGRNKLTSYSQHYLICRSCKLKISSTAKQTINKLLLDLKTKSICYLDIKRRLKLFLRYHHIPFLILKDHLEDRIKGYPAFYIPLKYDLDIFGKKKNLVKLVPFLKKSGYSISLTLYGWPDKPIPQYKFKPLDLFSHYPQIEYRTEAITILNQPKIHIMNRESVYRFTNDIWGNTKKIKKGKFTITDEYLFIHLILIYFLEDSCKGLNNLYRIYLLLKQHGSRLRWDKVRKISEKYGVKNVVNFVVILAQNNFGEISTFPKLESNRWILISLKIIDLDFICQAYYPSEGVPIRRKIDSYLHFLVEGLIQDLSLKYKILFFMHPKRLLFLLLALLKII